MTRGRENIPFGGYSNSRLWEKHETCETIVAPGGRSTESKEVEHGGGGQVGERCEKLGSRQEETNPRTERGAPMKKTPETS